MSDTRRDLSALTGGRADALTGKLAPRRQPTTPPTSPTSAEPEAAAPEETTSAPAVAVNKQDADQPTAQEQSRPTTTGPDPTRKRSWPAYVPAPVLDRINADLNGRTLGEWLLDAYEAINDELPQRFPQPTSTAGLPPRTARPRRNLGGAREVQWRFTHAEVAVLEARIAELGNPSRSAFITAIAELQLAHLDKD
ncbi:hypothetical protein AB0C98_43555 [Streptomyces sp. NPDC048558]|uniref:hypothetical protein n=1 Tax=Actinomycetes TaxID=1760 RepID=UPI003418805F